MARYRLALGMGCTVEELEARISSPEMTYWLAYYQLEPWGCEADDQRAALICKVIADRMSTREDGQPWEMSDFMLIRNRKTPVEKKPTGMTAEQQLDTARMITFVLQEMGKNGG